MFPTQPEWVGKFICGLSESLRPKVISRSPQILSEVTEMEIRLDDDYARSKEAFKRWKSLAIPPPNFKSNVIHAKTFPVIFPRPSL